MVTRRFAFTAFASLVLLGLLTPRIGIGRPAPAAQRGQIYLPFIGQAAALVYSSDRESGSAIVSLAAAGGGETISGPTTNDTNPVLSPDGRLIAFFSTRSGANGAYVAERDGSHPRQLAGCNICLQLAWSPDSRYLLLAQQDYGYYGSNLSFASIVAADGSAAPQRSYSVTAAWSPLGHQVAYIVLESGQATLWLDTLDTDERTPLAVERQISAPLAWSPDGTQIAYTASDGGASVIAIARADGRGARRLAAGYSPAWSPDSSRVAFLVRSADGYTNELALIDSDGRWRRSFGTVDTPRSALVWSPDGAELALVATKFDAATSTLYRAAIGGGLSASELGIDQPVQLAWSPDGAALLASANDTVEAAVIIIERGSGASRSPGAGRWAAWLPDGRVLAATLVSAPPTIYFAPGGGPSVRLGSGDLPALSPDGRQVAYVRDNQLRLIETSGRNDRLLADGLVISAQPSWSPDGSLIAFAAGKPYLVGADGGGLRKIADVPASSRLDWSPDGQRLTFSGDGVYVADLAGTGPRRIADGEQPVWSPDGTTIAYVTADTSLNAYLWLARADGANPAKLWSCADSPRSLWNCELGDISWAPDGRRIIFAEAGEIAGKAWYTGVVIVEADSGAEAFTGEGAAPRWVAGSQRLAYIRPERFGYFGVGYYERSSSYAKLCLPDMATGGCTAFPAGHGSVLFFDIGP